MMVYQVPCQDFWAQCMMVLENEHHFMRLGKVMVSQLALCFELPWEPPFLVQEASLDAAQSALEEVLPKVKSATRPANSKLSHVEPC